MKICPIVLSGGSGSRLWPLSRSQLPKQFVNLGSNKSLFQDTVSLYKNMPKEVLPPLIVCNENHRFLVSRQLKEIDCDHSGIILEPKSKNTAPAIALASAYLQKECTEDLLMLILPSDHIINSKNIFKTAVVDAKKYAEQGSLCTFGVRPSKPHIGYGYIETSNQTKTGLNNQSLMEVKSFKEKPDLETANKYLKGRNYLWNSGIFLFGVKRFLEVLKKTEPDIHRFCIDSVKSSKRDDNYILPDEQIFKKSPTDSIDYAVMEKAIDMGFPIHVALLNTDWSDLGSWDSLLEVMSKDKNGNAIKGDVIVIDTKNCLLHNDQGVLTAVGLHDMVLVNTTDALLVTSIDNTERVKEIVEELKSKGREEINFHSEVHRPWGTYETLKQGMGFQVKRIKVFPGEQLSLQLHHQRSEHWVVVSGKASVTLGEEEFTLEVNESTYIPLGTKHSLANQTNSMLELVEIQLGAYLGEDDIVRFEDRYGRIEDSQNKKKEKK